MAQNLVINGITYNGVDNIVITNSTGKKVTYIENLHPVTSPTVAKINNIEYKSVFQALSEAVSGNTVVMVSNSNENDKRLIIPNGVTLDLQSYTLTANTIVGVGDAKLNAVTKTDTVDGGKLIVNVNNLIMPEAPYVNAIATDTDAAIYIIPVWDNLQNCYIFSRIRVNHRTFTIENNILHYEFGHTADNYTNKTLWINGSANNKIKVALRLSWEFPDIKDNIHIDYIFPDSSISNVAQGGHVYNFDLDNFNDRNIDVDSLKATPMFISECGIIACGDSYGVNGKIN